MSLLFVYVTFGPILHIFIIHNQDSVVCLQQFCFIDVFIKSSIIISTHCRHRVASNTGIQAGVAESG